MIFLITGLPGSGKTLWTLSTVIAEYVAQGRPVYEQGLTGCNHDATGIKPWPHGGMEDWQKSEPGAVMIFDECQQWLKPRPTGSHIPDWVEALTRNRHGGVDLFLITQDPMLIDSYVRRLVNYHIHIVRPEGDPEMARVWKWSGCKDDVGKGRGLKSEGSEFKVWPYPKQNYALYKSAEIHTVKWKIPQSLRIVAIGLPVCLLLVGVAVWMLTNLGASPQAVAHVEAPTEETAKPAPPSAPASGPTSSPDAFPISSFDAAAMTQRDYVLRLIPRVEGMPVSAPIYDGLMPSNVPDIFCMSSEDSCTCLSEQGTRIRVADALCRTIARDGSYNPFRRAHMRQRS